MAELVWQGKSNPLSPTVSPRKDERPLWLDEKLVLPSTANPSALSFSWRNRLIQGDTQQVLPALLNDYPAAIDLIYIDPPFMTGRTFRYREAIAYNDTWNNDLDSYLQWLYETFVYLYALLAPDGSLYVHLDWRTTHYAKLLLDEVFRLKGREAGFKNEIIWHYQSGGNTRKHYARKHDTLLFYTKSTHYSFHPERVGRPRGAEKRNHMRKEVGLDGRVSWTIRSAGRIYTYDEESAMSVADVWNDISHLHQKDPQRTGYATQKPEALLERVILASSEENDLILDCFCGSGVTATVAERLGRRWITCDKSATAISTTHERLRTGERTQPFVLQQLYTGTTCDDAQSSG